MPRRPKAIDFMPAQVVAQLVQLGQGLLIARKRRAESRQEWALRIGVTEPTLARMEAGDPSVSMGVYATALWLMGRSAAMADLSAPEHDSAALHTAVQAAQKRSVRKRPVVAP